ncbi:CoA pyrophosphatase [Nitrospirillum iridis]|uniref:8-oxo-dGTP pyrophosphatase MutT (NUDIX family) n=1 Tax=Nitrospirillum iridis TaxID=765888 RepID=A0A7X0EC97_9PROT|nr:CoA pyrophosphatase [Nitrospirillum iridis]MBB6249781.1 8-oxo-dGTP pyrophosphatase MutT (NUDIX family) [Nitrospirillum iridis]
MAAAIRRAFPGRREGIFAPEGPGINVRGDRDGNGADVDGVFETPAAVRDAAVLVPLVDRPEGMTVLLTQRSVHLAAHGGQISFPGGRVEPEDTDAVATALRETEEEVGLSPTQVEVVGRLDTYHTRTGFRVVPVVGLVSPPFFLQPDPFEVQEVFEVPLAFILDPGSRQRQSREFKGAQRSFWVFPYNERYIWGATAGMLVNLCDVLGVPHMTPEGRMDFHPPRP